jgi:hypothetical protein
MGGHFGFGCTAGNIYDVISSYITYVIVFIYRNTGRTAGHRTLTLSTCFHGYLISRFLQMPHKKQRARLLSNSLQIEQLKLQLAKLRRMQFGRSSEQIDVKIAQLELTLEDLELRTAAAASAPPRCIRSSVSIALS